MDYGAMYIKWAKFAEENAETDGKLPKYQESMEVGALNKATDAPAFNEAKGYGNNSLKVYVNKFKENVINIEVTEIYRLVLSEISGAAIEEGTHKNMRFRTSDKAPYGGLGFFINKILDDGRDVCMGIFYPKVKAMLQGTEYNTNGENITLTTGKLQFTGAAAMSDDWKIESDYFETQEEAKAWVDGMFTGESTDIGKDEAGGTPEAQSAPARTSGKASQV